MYALVCIGISVLLFAQFTTTSLCVISSPLPENMMTLLQKETSVQPGSSIDVPGKCLQLHACHSL
jgi:hypothetical protein